ncbi:MAG: cytochrome c5 [Bacteroidia bacterium]|jgi:cytochrome c5
MIRIVFAVMALFAALSVTAADMSEAQRAAIEERIKPVGHSCMAGDADCGGGGGASAAAAGGVARSGEDVYGAACMACHSTGAGGAPKMGDAVAWVDRIAQGMDLLYTHGIEGVPGTSMMAKGGCMSCSDAEVIAAVDFMVEGSK